METIFFKDKNLERAILRHLKTDKSKPVITKSDMESLTVLHANDAKIADLTGLEYAINIETIDLDNNRIKDISPLSCLTKLRWIYIDNNPIGNISVLPEKAIVIHKPQGKKPCIEENTNKLNAFKVKQSPQKARL